MGSLRTDFDMFVDSDVRVKWYQNINSLNQTNGRLFFWQEKLWDEFIIVCPEYEHLSFAEISESFKFCYVHGEQLLETQVEMHHGSFRGSKWYTQNCLKSFPYARANTSYSGSGSDPATHRVALVCSECDREFERRNKSSKTTAFVPWIPRGRGYL